MVEAVSDEMVDAIALAGTPDEFASAAQRWEGVYERPLLLGPRVPGPGWRAGGEVAAFSST